MNFLIKFGNIIKVKGGFIMVCCKDNNSGKKAVYLVCFIVLMLVACCLWLAEYGRCSED